MTFGRGWRTTILDRFRPEYAPVFPLTVVHDPDGLISDPELGQAIEAAGFLLRVHDDSVPLRFAYERKVREPRDRGLAAPALVVVHRGRTLQELPFDLLERARVAHRSFTFRLSELFPSLAPAALDDVEPALLDRLDRVLRTETVESRRGVRLTRDLLLSALFSLDVERLEHVSDLLSFLCRMHLDRVEMPSSLASHAVDRCKDRAGFDAATLERLATERSAFLGFLQAQWEAHVGALAEGVETRERRTDGGDPIVVPFDDPTTRAAISSLHLSGELRPVEWSGDAPEPPDMRWGIERSSVLDPAERVATLLDEVEASLPAADATYLDWLAFAPRWGECSAMSYEMQPAPAALAERLEHVWGRIDNAFGRWMGDRYAALELIPKPVMVHKVVHLLRRRLEKRQGTKVALLVMDGMAWSQWVALRQGLADVVGGEQLSEKSAFAWVPTITPVSRQAIYAGVPPREFPDTVGDTNRDEKHWTSFWREAGLPDTAIHFVPPKADASQDAARLRAAADHPSCRVLAMTVPTIDEMMHGAVQGAHGLHAQVAYWAKTDWLGDGISMLLDRGFEVWITSDHGNIECRGEGRPNEGVLAGQRGNRVRAYSDEAVRRLVAGEHDHSVIWHPAGLPDKFLPLLAGGRAAFAPKGQTIVSHGGISLEEVIVPLIRIEPLGT